MQRLRSANTSSLGDSPSPTLNRSRTPARASGAPSPHPGGLREPQRRTTHMLLASDEQVGQLVRCRVFALVAIAQQSPRSPHYERGGIEMAAAAVERLSDRAGAPSRLDGRFQAPLVPRIAVLGSDLRPGSGGGWPR